MFKALKLQGFHVIDIKKNCLFYFSIAMWLALQKLATQMICSKVAANVIIGGE